MLEVKTANRHLGLQGTQNFIFRRNLDLYVFYLFLNCRDNIVGLVILNGLEDPGFESQWGLDFPCPSRMAPSAT
jgi:hypothetical protein